MRQFKERTRKVKEVTSIVCNKCGRVIPVVEGVPQEDVLTVDKRWGYFSEKDNRRDDAAAVQVAYIPDGALQWKQSSGRLWRGNTDCDKRKGMEL